MQFFSRLTAFIISVIMTVFPCLDYSPESDDIRLNAAIISDTHIDTRLPCGKYLLEVNGKKGKMLVCQDRDCGYRKSISVITNARCPECHKKLEMRGEGDKKAFFCVCGYREKLSDFEKRKESSGAGKRDVAKYMQQQAKQKPAGNALADQLAKWMEENK